MASTIDEQWASSAPVRCECGEATGEPCEWRGPLDETACVEWMPEYLRASHAAAGNAGEYPHNGSVRLRCEIGCADRLAHVWIDGEMTQQRDPWVRVIPDSVAGTTEAAR